MPGNLPAPFRKPSQRLLTRFSSFIKHHPPASVSRHLRRMLLGYIHSRLDAGLPLDFDLWLEEMDGLFDLLDCAAAEAS